MGRGERRLFHAVRHIVARYHPAAVFIYNTCVPAMEGDDPKRYASRADRHRRTGYRH